MTSFHCGQRGSAREPDPAPDADAAPSTGPGWYESSWDLLRGLLVVEDPDEPPAVPTSPGARD
jgi:hypothetical protein